MTKWWLNLFVSLILIAILSQEVCSSENETNHNAWSGSMIGIVLGASFSRGSEYVDVPGIFRFELNSKNRVRATGGLSYTYYVSDFFAIQLEINYVEKGGAKSKEVYAISKSLKVNYISLPVMMKFRMTKLDKWYRFGLILGGELSLLTSGANELSVSGDVVKDTNIKGTDVAIITGGFWEVDIFSGKFTYSVRHSMGLSDIYEDQISLEREYDFRNSSVYMTVGYSLFL